MRVVRASAAEVLGLFVGDWSQAIGILAILALGYALVRVVHAPLLGFALTLVLAAHLVWTSVRESRDERAG